jgi:hypothetical protein
VRECSVPIRRLDHRFVSFQIMPSARFAFGRWRVDLEVLSEKWAAIQTVKCESESYSAEGVGGLTAKVFGGDFDLFRRTCSLKIVNPYFKHQGGLLMLDFARV